MTNPAVVYYHKYDIGSLETQRVGYVRRKSPGRQHSRLDKDCTPKACTPTSESTSDALERNESDII